MSLDHSVTVWLDGIKAGDGGDISRLWDRYFKRLVRLAGTRLPAHCRRSFDEEDVALSAFRSFCARAGRGQFPQLDDRDDLWRLLATITMRKALARLRSQSRQKRGGGRVLGESALVADNAPDGARVVEVLACGPGPEEVACFADDYTRFLERLDDPALRTVAMRRLEGWSCEEIARELNVSTKTVDRKLRVIRAVWSRENP